MFLLAKTSSYIKEWDHNIVRLIEQSCCILTNTMKRLVSIQIGAKTFYKRISSQVVYHYQNDLKFKGLLLLTLSYD